MDRATTFPDGSDFSEATTESEYMSVLRRLQTFAGLNRNSTHREWSKLFPHTAMSRARVYQLLDGDRLPKTPQQLRDLLRVFVHQYEPRPGSRDLTADRYHEPGVRLLQERVEARAAARRQRRAAADDPSTPADAAPAADHRRAPLIPDEVLGLAGWGPRSAVASGVRQDRELVVDDAHGVVYGDPASGELTFPVDNWFTKARNSPDTDLDVTTSTPPRRYLLLSRSWRSIIASCLLTGLAATAAIYAWPPDRPAALATQNNAPSASPGSPRSAETWQGDVQRYLNELNPVGTSSYDRARQTGGMAGKVYLHTIAVPVQRCSAADAIEYNIAKGHRRLVMSAGLDDDSEDSSLKIQLEVFGDSRKLTSVFLELGKLSPIDLDVTGVLRLRISWQPISAHQNCTVSNNYFDLGDAHLLGDADKVPTTPTPTH